MVSLKWGLGVGSLWFLEEIRITELRKAAGPPLWGLVSSNPLRARTKQRWQEGEVTLFTQSWTVHLPLPWGFGAPGSQVSGFRLEFMPSALDTQVFGLRLDTIARLPVSPVCKWKLWVVSQPPEVHEPILIINLLLSIICLHLSYWFCFSGDLEYIL